LLLANHGLRLYLLAGIFLFAPNVGIITHKHVNLYNLNLHDNGEDYSIGDEGWIEWYVRLPGVTLGITNVVRVVLTGVSWKEML
jgi:hypothetical protein